MDVGALERTCYTDMPDTAQPGQRVAFGRQRALPRANYLSLPRQIGGEQHKGVRLNPNRGALH